MSNIWWWIKYPFRRLWCWWKGHKWTSWWGMCNDDNITIDYWQQYCVRCLKEKKTEICSWTTTSSNDNYTTWNISGESSNGFDILPDKGTS